MDAEAHIACHQCDLLIKLDQLPEHHKALCPRCGHTLSACHRNAKNRVVAFAFTALVFLVLSHPFPFLTFSAQGHDRTVSLLQSIAMLASGNFPSLAVLVFLSIIVIPTLLLLSALYAYLSLMGKRLPLPGTLVALKLIGHLQHWSMAEIFLIGILVSFIKIISLADVGLGLSFWSYVLFIVSTTAAMLHIDKRQAWQWIKEKNNIRTAPVSGESGYTSCHVCTGVSAATRTQCGICGSHLHRRITNSLQKTWALLITSIVLYIPANSLPIMRTTFLGEETANTIIGGVLVLWEHGSYPIALIIFIASVFIPLGKILALSWLCLGAQRRSNRSHRQKTRLYRITEFMGRWSMVDVFVVAVLVALIQLGNIMSIYPGWGALAFAGMVIVTILAALSFDPRLIWDPLNQENHA